MTETGRILRIEGKTVTLKGGELTGCFGCMNQECRQGGSLLTAENAAGLKLAVGDLAEIGVSGARTAAQAAQVLLPPFAAGAAAYAAVAVLWPAADEALRAAVGAVALALGFVGVYLWRRASPGAAGPVVLRKVAEPPTDADERPDVSPES